MPGDRVRDHGELSRGKEISSENRKRIVTLGEGTARGGPEQRRACHGGRDSGSVTDGATVT